MQFITKGSYYKIILSLIILYFLYVIYDRTIIDDNLLNYSIIDQHENNLNESRNNIDTLIVGGSNAFYGLSAEQMTKEIDMNVYNLSLAYEGYSLNNYVYYLKSVIQNKDQINLILVSSLKYFDFYIEEEPNKNIYGSSTITFYPKKSILKRIYELFTKKDVLNKFNFNKYGDLSFVEFSCEYKTSAQQKEIRPFSYIYIDEMSKKLKETFTNAEIVFLLPPFYQNKPKYSKNLEKLYNTASKQGYNFYIEEDFSSKELMCQDNHHPNAKGREIRTKKIIDLIKNRKN